MDKWSGGKSSIQILVSSASINFVLLSYSEGENNAPNWIYTQWKETWQKYHRRGGCTIVGFNDRGYKLSAVECNKEVADIVCQPA